MGREEVIDKVLLTAQPTRRFVTPQEVAAFAVFLASEEAALPRVRVQAANRNARLGNTEILGQRARRGGAVAPEHRADLRGGRA